MTLTDSTNSPSLTAPALVCTLKPSPARSSSQLMAGQALRAADILVFRPPTWMGHMSSIAQRALERLDAELSLMDDQGRPEIYDKVAVVALVGNEDGAHAIIADVFQGLNDGTTRTLGTCPQRSPPPPPPHSPPRPPMSHRC